MQFSKYIREAITVEYLSNTPIAKIIENAFDAGINQGMLMAAKESQEIKGAVYYDELVFENGVSTIEEVNESEHASLPEGGRWGTEEEIDALLKELEEQEAKNKAETL